VSKITAVFFDVGGVLLTNGWDQEERERAVKAFGLDGAEVEARHRLWSAEVDAGRLSLDEYVERSIFYRPRAFSRDEMRDFIYRQSQPLPDSLALAARLAKSGKYFLATLNNESRELNRHRIETFGLRHYFSVFFSSCYLGVSKPDAKIYRLALDISQRQADECVFIDDRPLNLEGARAVGLHTILFQNAGQLENDLRSLGVVA
jgi:putative hydrolase of the HAD superfamily